MTKINAETVARIQLSNSVLLRAVSDALSYDLQIAPIVIASAPGIATANLLTAIARSMFGGNCVEIRCAQMHESELEPQPVLRNGEIEMLKPSLSVVRNAISAELGSLILLDDAVAGEAVTRAVLAQIAREAVGPVIVAIQVSTSEEEQALRIVKDEIGLHRAHVPTARLAVDASRAPVAQPVLLSGSMQLQGSKCGERYMEMYVAEPFDQDIRFTIVAKPDQDDDAMNAAIWTEDRDPVFARLEVVRGSLQCTTDDITCS